MNPEPYLNPDPDQDDTVLRAEPSCLNNSVSLGPLRSDAPQKRAAFEELLLLAHRRGRRGRHEHLHVLVSGGILVCARADGASASTTAWTGRLSDSKWAVQERRAVERGRSHAPIRHITITSNRV